MQASISKKKWEEINPPNILGYYVKNLIWDMKLLNYLKFLVSAEQVKILRY